MHGVLSALFTTEVLEVVLLTVVGVFVFLLVRPREQDAPEEFWLTFMQQHVGTSNPGPKAGSKPDMPGAEGANQASRDRTAGVSRF